MDNVSAYPVSELRGTNTSQTKPADSNTPLISFGLACIDVLVNWFRNQPPPEILVNDNK